MMISMRIKALLPVCVFLGAVLNLSVVMAGTYIFAGDGNGLDVITHPSGYIGTGGVVDVEVCIADTAVDAAAMEISVKNIVTEINSMMASTPNLIFGSNNNIPSGSVDFESLTLHELGHCTGLGHPNIGAQSGVSAAERDFTKTTDGVDNLFAFDSGTDTVIGSADDQRGDDENLHWFQKGVNNPFLGILNPEGSNFSRSILDLPNGHDFVANASRDVGALLGFTDTEAVMQQGQFFDEDQRALQADDVTTYRMGMSGLDEIAGTTDDYTINMVYGGIKADTTGCDIVIESQQSGFGVCTVGGQFLNANHLSITTATFKYNSDFNTWFFNPVLNVNCSAGDDTLSFSSVTHNDTQNHDACISISYGPDYTVGASGNVTATAPVVTLEPGTTINGTFTVNSTVP